MLAPALDRLKPAPAKASRPARHFLRMVVSDRCERVADLVADTISLEAMLQAVAERGDLQAFLSLFQHFAPRIKGYLRRQGSDAAVADDLAQEVMLKVWRNAASFDPAKASAATWVFAITRNTRIDVLRRVRRPEVDMDDAALVQDPAPLADDAVAGQERERRVQRALRTLPADQAQVVRLSFFQHKPHAEIAAELRLPLGTVKSRLRLAFARLREALREDWE